MVLSIEARDTRFVITHPGVSPRLDFRQTCVYAIQRNHSVEKGLVRNVRMRTMIGALYRQVAVWLQLDKVDTKVVSSDMGLGRTSQTRINCNDPDKY